MRLLSVQGAVPHTDASVESAVENEANVRGHGAGGSTRVERDTKSPVEAVARRSSTPGQLEQAAAGYHCHCNPVPHG